MKGIRIIGLVIFFLAFGLFNTAFFMENYVLSTEIVERNLPDDHRKGLFSESANGMIDKVFKANQTFISAIENAVRDVNEKVGEIYEISEAEKRHLLSLQNDQFNVSMVDSVFDRSTDAGNFKAEKLIAYISWLDGKPVDEEVSTNLSNSISSINQWEVISNKGFDKYSLKDLKYVLTKSSSVGPISSKPTLFLLLSVGGAILGALFYLLPGYKDEPAGIRNNGIFTSALKNRGWLGIGLGVYLIAFYLLLYFFHPYMTSWIIMVDPLSFVLKNAPAGQFFLYGFLYTLVILVMGVRMIIKYRFSKYQVFRTLSVMFFQLSFAFLIPEILLRLNQPYFDFKNIWPLDYDFFFDYELNNLIANGTLGIFMLVWGIVLIVVAVPVLVYFFGKRWYCSWVCGCGGLAETMGDPFRQLSDKSLKSWKIERFIIHGVLVFAVVMTGAVLYTYFTGSSQLLGFNSYAIRETYGVYIGAWFAGVVGTGFYPFMGSRVWCRFGCPLAAYLGLVQRFKSRFRITTNGGQCISCGNCSTYCEMGIDVRWYAQREQDIVRSSCVGCGICSQVCPRGVLKLENTSAKRNI